MTVKPHITDVGLDTCYSCNSKDMIEGDSVNQTLWNVLIQAFVTNGSKSEQSKCRCSVPSRPACIKSVLFTLIVYSLFSPYTVTSCAADVPTTPVVPTTHPTSTTTAAPVTNATSPAPPPTTTPTPTLPTPSIGKYSIKPDENSTACLLANFGLRIGYKQAEAC